jgi:hypothetical protein
MDGITAGDEVADPTLPSKGAERMGFQADSVQVRNLKKPKSQK